MTILFEVWKPEMSSAFRNENEMIDFSGRIALWWPQTFLKHRAIGVLSCFEIRTLLFLDGFCPAVPAFIEVVLLGEEWPDKKLKQLEDSSIAGHVSVRRITFASQFALAFFLSKTELCKNKKISFQLEALQLWQMCPRSVCHWAMFWDFTSTSSTAPARGDCQLSQL